LGADTQQSAGRCECEGAAGDGEQDDPPRVVALAVGHGPDEGEDGERGGRGGDAERDATRRPQSQADGEDEGGDD